MDELDRAMQETELALNEMQKKRNEFNTAHQERMKQLNDIAKSIESFDATTSYNFNKDHEETMKELDDMSKELDDLLSDMQPELYDELSKELNNKNE